MPGYGQVSLNGQDVDGAAGTRSWSQYDKRTLYHTYDVAQHLLTDEDSATARPSPLEYPQAPL